MNHCTFWLLVKHTNIHIIPISHSFMNREALLDNCDHLRMSITIATLRQHRASLVSTLQNILHGLIPITKRINRPQFQ